MQTYWDLTEKERAALKREDVERFLDAELMTKGVVKVDPPELEDVPETPDVPKSIFFRVVWKDGDYSYNSFKSDFVFDDADRAQKFLDLRPRRIKEPYRELPRLEPIANPAIETVECANEQDWLNAKTAVEAAKAVQRRNEVAESEFATASKKQKDVLDGVWSDWAECRNTHAEHKRVLDTMANYTATAGGDTETAAKFLTKAFGELEIKAAYRWFDLDCPCVFDEDEAVKAV